MLGASSGRVTPPACQRILAIGRHRDDIFFRIAHVSVRLSAGISIADLSRMTRAPQSIPAFALFVGVLLPLSPAGAATIEIFPSNADASCSEEFENRANNLQPGDVLILH